MNGENPYTQGYETAYREIYQAFNSADHLEECGECRPCGVAKEIVEILMESLAGKLTQEEFFTLSFILARRNATIIDSSDHVRIDWWGLLNDVANEGNIYD